MAARKTTVHRDGSETLSSWTLQGSVRDKDGRDYQKACGVLLQ